MDQAEYDRLTKDMLPPPLELPGKAGHDAFRHVAQSDGGVEAQNPPLRLSQDERDRIKFLMKELAQLWKQTNLTASLPAYNAPHIWSTPVDLTATVVVPLAVQPAYVTAVSYTVPPGRRAVIQGYGVDVQDPAYTYDGSILWRIQHNGLNVQTLADWGEHRGSLNKPRPTFIPLMEGDTVTLQVRRAVAAAGAQNVAVALNGWTWRPRYNYEGTKVGVTAS